MKKKFARYFGLLLALLVSTGGGGVAFAYQAAPLVQTRAPLFITEKSVQLRGSVNPNEMSDTYVWFEWGISGREGTVYETPRRRFWSGSTFSDTDETIIGLAPNTQYFYRVVAENGRGKDVGLTTYFTTRVLPEDFDPVVIVETRPTGFVDGNDATLRGYLSPHGANNARYWFQWGPTMELGNETPHSGHSGDAGEVEVRLSRLESGTPYYYRLVAETGAGRAFGVTRIFITTGTPPPAESPRAQSVPTTITGADSAYRTTSHAGDTTGNILGAQTTRGLFNNGGSDTAYGLPGASATSFPGNFFAGLFGGSRKTTTETGPLVQGGASVKSGDVTAAVSESASGGLLDAILGVSKATVAIEKIGPKTITLHTPVEYRIAYRYLSSLPAEKGLVKVTLPHEVVYIGDNTNNELLLEEGGGGERTYVLPTGSLRKGDQREFSILAMTTGSAKGFPDARVKLEWTDRTGTRVISGATGAGVTQASANSASVATSGRGILPTSLFGWVFYILLLLATLFGYRKAREYYLKRKEMLAQERTENGYDPEMISRLLPQPGGK